MKVFLGGTCNDTTWRDELIKKLKINYFNPVVDDWTKRRIKESYKKEKVVISACIQLLQK